MSKKPRSDAKLLSLPPHYKETLIRWLTEENINYDEARARLKKEFSVVTSNRALSQFYATQCFTLKYSQAREIADTVDEAMKDSPDKFDEATRALVRQKAFERALAKDGNLDELALLAKILHDSKKLQIKEGDQKIAERRIAILEKKAAKADEAQEVTENKNLTEAEKLARIKRIFGG